MFPEVKPKMTISLPFLLTVIYSTLLKNVHQTTYVISLHFWCSVHILLVSCSYSFFLPSWTCSLNLHLMSCSVSSKLVSWSCPVSLFILYFACSVSFLVNSLSLCLFLMCLAHVLCIFLYFGLNIFLSFLLLVSWSCSVSLHYFILSLYF